jgi:hypothetical protein
MLKVWIVWLRTFATKMRVAFTTAQRICKLLAYLRMCCNLLFYSIFISEMPIEKVNRSINFYPRSLARFPNTASVCTGSADFVDCLKESAHSGVNQVKLNSSSLPLWQIGDVTHARADTL